MSLLWNENQLIHYFIRILLGLYMFRAHRPIFRRVQSGQIVKQWLCEQLYELS